MAKKTVLIVGGGLFGCIAGRLAAQYGHQVRIFDVLQPEGTASQASGCVLAPSWMTALDAQSIDSGLSVLDTLYGLRTIEFQTNLLAKFKAQQVDPDAVLNMLTEPYRVTSVTDGEIRLETGDRLRGHVLVAAGIWSQALIPSMPKIKAFWGASVRFRTGNAPSRIKVYAPYRQAVGYQLNRSEAWAGDGTALVESTWIRERDDRVRATVERGRALLELPPSAKFGVRVGARPYVEGFKAGFYAQLAPRLHVSTGGAKNGTILAAAQANRYVREVLK